MTSNASQCPTQHHPDPQWILVAYDHHKGGAIREFAMADITEIYRPGPPVPADPGVDPRPPAPAHLMADGTIGNQLYSEGAVRGLVAELVRHQDGES